MKTTMTDNKVRVHVNLAKLKKNGEMFEVDIDPDLAIKFKKGVPGIDIHDVLKAEHIFRDAQKGMVVSSSLLEEVFKTDDVLAIAAIIIRDGEIQLTSEYRNELREQKKRRIISIIQQNGIDPRTKLPHPGHRIESAIEEARIKIDEHKRAEDQVQDVVDGLRAILPISFVMKQIWMKLSAQFAHKSQGALRSMGKIMKENWGADGSWDAIIEIPGGMQEDFFDKLNSLTKGTAQTKIMN
ncbi:MAG TPA: ribosome assembly factor SBDS [Candidatus Nanoarchaeia archaeon]|nr:ribosome assembly factor SBDS [Candidatus Nanoarchaeia archaeon]